MNDHLNLDDLTQEVEQLIGNFPEDIEAIANFFPIGENLYCLEIDGTDFTETIEEEKFLCARCQNLKPWSCWQKANFFELCDDCRKNS
jgi:hypothetical protein